MQMTDATEGSGDRHTARTRENPGLSIPGPPTLDGTLPVRGAPLERAGPAREHAPFTHAGLRAAVVGSQTGGVAALWVHPLRVLQRLETVDADAARFATTPAGVERELELGGATVRERVAVPLALPAAILEWELDPAASEPVEIRVAWRAELHRGEPGADADRPLQWRVDGRALYAAAGRGDDAALFAWSREPERWEVDDDPGGARPGLRCAAVVRLEPGRPVRMAVAATHSGPGAIESAVAALRRVDGVVHARTAALRRARRERLVVQAPDPEIGPAVEWARHRLDSYLVQIGDAGRCLVAGYGPAEADRVEIVAGDAVWTALACLATGDFDSPREVVRFLGAHQDADGRIPHTCATTGLCRFDGPDPTPLYLLLAGRFLAWSGDVGLLRREWQRVMSAYAHCLRRDGDGDGLPESGHRAPTLDLATAAVWTAALRDFGDAAETLGETATAGEAREHARRAEAALESVFYDTPSGLYAQAVERTSDSAMDSPRSEPHHEIGGGPGRQRLPVVGAPARPRWRRDLDPSAHPALPLILGVGDAARFDAWLRAAAGTLDPSAAGPLETGWISWAEFRAGQTAASRHWLTLVGSGLEGARATRGETAGGGRSGQPDRARATAMVVAPLVYGLLGVEPDATRGRVRIAPRIPAEWTTFEASNLRVGDVRVRLRYSRDGRTHRFFVEQQSGAVPINVVFEPHLPAATLGSARIDGQAATLDARRVGERLAVPVQIVLDEGRTIELETGSE